MAETIQEKIDEIARSGVKEATVDGATTKRFTPAELAEADQATATNTAMGKNHLGLRFRKLKPPGGGL